MDKQLKPHMDLAKDQGWEVTDDGAQLTLTHPEKGTVRIPARVSQGRALNNAEMTLRRGGVDISSLKPKKRTAPVNNGADVTIVTGDFDESQVPEDALVLDLRGYSLDQMLQLGREDLEGLTRKPGEAPKNAPLSAGREALQRIYSDAVYNIDIQVRQAVERAVHLEHERHASQGKDADIALEEAEKAEQRYLNEKKRADKLQADLDEKIADNGALLERARQAESRLETLRSALAAVNA